MCSLYMAASFWHPSSPRMFSLEVSLITMSTFEMRKPRGHVAPNDLLGKLWAAEPMCYFNESFHTFIFFYSPLLQGTIATTRQEPMLPACSVKLRLKVMSSFLKLTATLIIVMMFMWCEKKSSSDKRKHDSHFASYTKFSNNDRMQCNFSKKKKMQ